MKRLLVAALLSLAADSGAQAEMVAGWDVNAKASAEGVCTAKYAYRDKDDNNAENVVTLLLGRTAEGPRSLTVSLSYDGWDWDKGETVEADLLIDDDVFAHGAKWEAQSKYVLTSRFRSGDELLGVMSRGEEIVLNFDGDEDDTASFRIPNAEQALAALQLCQR